MLLSREGDRPLKDDVLVLGTFFLVALLLCLCLKGWASYYMAQNDMTKLQSEAAHWRAGAKQPRCEP